MTRLIAFLTLGLIGAALSQCPHEDLTLVSWTDSSAWKNGQVPQDNEDGTLTGKVLLDSQPATIHHLTISPGAKLVFDPDTDVHLKVHAIYVEGEIHIGHKDCLFQGNAHVTFLGNVNEDKILLVRGGGTLEIHGERKLPWTKLASTAPKLESTPGIKDVQDLLELCNDKCRSGLLLYEINPVSGEVEKASLFDFLVTWSEIENRIQQFLQALIDIPDGKIVGLAIKRNIISSSNYDITSVFDAIDILAHDGNQQSPIRQADAGSAYALLTIKGNPSSTVEEFEANVGETHVITAKAYIGEHAFVLDSSVTNNGGGCNSFVELHVYLDEHYRPTITLLDDVDTWKVGDKLIMASTDYNPRQAEEVTILEIKGQNQVRLSGPLQFTHYGEIEKGIDMRAEIGLLSRNVKFDSEDAATSTTYGGHIKILKDFNSVHIEGAELEGLGQQEVIGAYSIHFHLCESLGTEEATRTWVRQNSIHHSKSRCLTIHGTHDLLIQDNVCYKTIGHSYFFEDGGEQRNILERNLGLGTEKPPAGKGLIPTDTSCATTFWVTNPKNRFRHNAAAGSDCRGFWFNYPDLPVGPSSTMGFMLEREARFTAIYEFVNNVAHSCKNAGLFLDNILKPNGKSEGYNKYRPMKDPVINNCMEDASNCEDECVNLIKYTGYKNAKQNAWIRGGCIKLIESSMTDSTVGVALLRDNAAYQFVERSIIMGDSNNAGEPEAFLPSDGSLQRSFPFGTSESMRNTMHVGVEIFKGPFYINDVWFNNFKDTENYYPMGAIGFRRNNGAKSSPRTTITNAKFGFNDKTDGNRVREYHPEDELYTEQDGDVISSFRDGDSSVTDATCSDPAVTVTVVRPEPFHMTSQCYLRSNWNMAWCCHNFGEVKIKDSSAIDDGDIVTMVRDDIPSVEVDANFESNAPFLVILGGEYSYSMFYDSTMPVETKLQTVGITNTNFVRIGVCLPPNAEFNLKVFHPDRFNSIDKWTEVTSLAELDADTEGGKYFYHAESGYFATILRNKEDFLDDEYHENPRNKAVDLTITINNGDRTKTRCLAAARAALGDLSPQQSTKRNLITLLRQLLRDTKRAKRSAAGSDDNRELSLDDIDPPQNWGARSSHVPWTQ